MLRNWLNFIFKRLMYIRVFTFLMMAVALIWKNVPESHSSFDSSERLIGSYSTLKMEAICVCETSGPLRTEAFQPTGPYT
jgi:hypothetical protein